MQFRHDLPYNWTECGNCMSLGQLLCNIWAFYCDWHMQCRSILHVFLFSVFNLCQWELSSECG